jgi:hypothetical protein
MRRWVAAFGLRKLTLETFGSEYEVAGIQSARQQQTKAHSTGHLIMIGVDQRAFNISIACRLFRRRYRVNVIV